MQIERVSINLIDAGRRDRRGSMRAFARIDVISGDCRFVVRDLKVIASACGKLKVVMPSRTLDFHCEFCGKSNQFDAAYCNRCGGALPARKLPVSASGATVRSYDSFFPADDVTRDRIADAVLKAYEEAEKGGQE